MYPNVALYIDGAWRPGAKADTLPIENPATGETIGQLAVAEISDLEEAVLAAERSFKTWRKVAAFDRSKIMRKAGDLLRARAEDIGRILTMEQGKPLVEAVMEATTAADTIDWFAEEGRRAYGRVIPARASNVVQIVVKEPVGPVAAFSPWNFPINQAVRKISAALTTGCTIVLKGPEDTPASCAALVQAFTDAGVPAGVINLVFGRPAEISEYLIAHPAIRKVTFTGSTSVGKHLAMMAGKHMKRATMELGGHAPAIVFEDADFDLAVKSLGAYKFRNAGQVCASPTRFLVHESLYGKFVDSFVKIAESLKVGDGLTKGTQIGALAHGRRIDAMEGFVADARAKGGKVRTGGSRIGNKGHFFQPTILTDLPVGAKIMNEEPFGPIACIAPFSDFDSLVNEANRLSYGLAAYAYTRSSRTATAISEALETGMVGINNQGLAMPETPFGGVKDSGYGSEGGSEAIEPYLVGKFITHLMS